MEAILTVDEARVLENIKETPTLENKMGLAPKFVERGYVRHSLTTGHNSITEIGREALFYRRCFNSLMAFSKNSHLIVPFDCEIWLCSSGYMQRKSIKEQMHFFDFEITQKGKDWIAFIASGV